MSRLPAPSKKPSKNPAAAVVFVPETTVAPVSSQLLPVAGDPLRTASEPIDQQPRERIDHPPRYSPTLEATFLARGSRSVVSIDPLFESTLVVGLPPRIQSSRSVVKSERSENGDAIEQRRHFPVSTSRALP